MRLWAVLLLMASAQAASGHMVFILADPETGRLAVVFNDKLRVDDRVSSDRLTSLRLVSVDGAGGACPVEWKREKDHLSASIPAPRPAMVGGDVVYGYARSRHTGDKPVLIKHYPKAVLGPINSAVGLRLNANAKYEIAPELDGGRLRLRVFRDDGSPAPGAVCVTMRGGDEDSRARGVTDEDGGIPGFVPTPGRFGVWAKVVEPTPGVWEGRPYDEVHHYATLVFDVPGDAPAGAAPDSQGGRP